jgi:hypothetical protein
MKRILLATILSSGISIGFSQALYFNISGGYGAPALQQTQQPVTFLPQGTDPANSIIVPMLNQNTSDSASFRFKTNLYKGYATGGTLSLTMGYFINPYVGFEVGFSSLIPQKMYNTSTYDDYDVLGPNTTIKTTTWSYGITMSPGIRLHACKPDAKVVPYGRFALSLPLWGATKHELDIKGDHFFPKFLNVPAQASVHTTTKSIFSIGFNGSIGVGYNITKWVRIYGEVVGQYLFVRSGKTTLTQYLLTVDGQTEDRLKTFSTFSKETEFVDELNENSNTETFGKKRVPLNVSNPDPNEYVNEDRPRQELRRSANFSAFGGMIGFAFTINNKMWKKKKPVPVHN